MALLLVHFVAFVLVVIVTPALGQYGAQLPTRRNTAQNWQPIPRLVNQNYNQAQPAWPTQSYNQGQQPANGQYGQGYPNNQGQSFNQGQNGYYNPAGQYNQGQSYPNGQVQPNGQAQPFNLGQFLGQGQQMLGQFLGQGQPQGQGQPGKVRLPWNVNVGAGEAFKLDLSGLGK